MGTLEGTELEIYGNVTVNGYLYVSPFLDNEATLTSCRRCKRLVVYGSLTLIGPESSYTVDETEEVAGAVLMREQEADWDWQ